MYVTSEVSASRSKGQVKLCIIIASQVPQESQLNPRQDCETNQTETVA